MMKQEKGITLVVLIITVILMVIISSTVITISLDRLDINKLKKMKSDLELLGDKVANYYLKYEELPILRNSENEKIVYPNASLNFAKNSADNSNYYILDLSAIDGISLNYGKEGFENPNQSDDVYIINELTHTIYYVKGIELDGETYHYINAKNGSLTDNIPPSIPEIKIISGVQDEDGVYITVVELEIIPGKDNWSRIRNTTYSINGGTEYDIMSLENNILELMENGTHTIVVKSYDNSNKVNYSSQEITIKIKR